MNRWFLALPFLLIAAGLTSANYILIIVNLGEQNELSPGGKEGPLAGPGRPGGALGNLGAAGGNVGLPPAGAIGNAGAAGQLGAQLGGQLGAQLGGQRGLGGVRGKAPPPPEIIIDPDASPLHIVAIVEMTQPPLFQRIRSYEQGQMALPVKHKWGESALMSRKGITSSSLIRLDKNFLPSVQKRFLAKFDPKRPETRPSSTEKFTADQLFEIAEWALAHGLVGKEDRVAQVMDRLAEVEPKHPAVAPYLKVKAGLAKSLPKAAVPPGLRGRLSANFKVAESSHYLLLHDLAAMTGAEPPEVRSRLDRLEETYKAFFYWFALRNANPLPEMPGEKLVAVLTANEKEFDRLHDQFLLGQLAAGITAESKEATGGLGGLGAKAFKPLVVSDGFYGRRDNVVVFSSKRLDELYDALEKQAQSYWQGGFNRIEILKGRKGAGMPRGATEDQAVVVQCFSLLYKAMEYDAELSSTTHDGTRQLLYASGLLPRNVIVPEWVEFGLGSFFETSPGSPWSTVGTVNHEYLTPFRAWKKAGKLERTPVDTMRAIITDGYFRRAPAGADRSAALRKARATTWSLTYFLAQRKLDGLFRYFKELNKMPRDLELNDEALLMAFARAFDCLDATKKVNTSKLNALANQWNLFIEQADVEAEMQAVQKQVRDKLREVTSKEKDDPKQPGGTPKPPGT